MVRDISKISRNDSTKFSAKNVKQGRQGKIIVEFNSNQDLNNAFSAFNKNSLALKYNSRELKKRTLRMLVNGATIIKNKSGCKEFIEHSNPDIAGKTLEVVTIIEKGKSCCVILEMSPKIRGEILKRRGLNFGFLRLHCEDYTNLYMIQVLFIFIK